MATRIWIVAKWTIAASVVVGASVTMDRMAQDGIEVAEFVRAKLHKSKVLVVGTGQGVNQRQFKAVAYAQLLAEARTRGDRLAISELTAIGHSPYDSVSKAVHTK